MNNLSYYAVIGDGNHLGVLKKISNLCAVARKKNFSAQERIFNNSIKDILRFVWILCFEKADVIFIRYYDVIMPFLIFPVLLLRFKGKRVIIDIPTPISVTIKEMEQIKNTPKRILRMIYVYISGFWVLLPYNTVVQYGSESSWFSLFLKKKILTQGNGILIDDSLPLCRDRVVSKLRLIGVAKLAIWHGYDRVIRALANIDFSTLDYDIQFTVVGDGDALTSLIKLAQDYGVEDKVEFLGSVQGNALNTVFANKHIGIASLGLYRIGLEEASTLKTREYMARGLPVIAAAKDFDIPEDNKFRIQISNDDSIEELVSILLNHDILTSISPQEIREFAKNKLSLETKFYDMLSHCDTSKK